jgi:hypothetical protein
MSLRWSQVRLTHKSCLFERRWRQYCSSLQGYMRRCCRHHVGAPRVEVVNPVTFRNQSVASERFSDWVCLAFAINVWRTAKNSRIFRIRIRDPFTPEFIGSKESELFAYFPYTRAKIVRIQIRVLIQDEISRIRSTVLYVKPLTCEGAPCRVGAAHQQKLQQLGSLFRCLPAVKRSLVAFMLYS